MQDSIAKKVLQFYDNCPFNYFTSIQQACLEIKQANIIQQTYPDLHKILLRADRMLELGCGVGWLSAAASYHYSANVLGLDFNPKAIEIANRLQSSLNLKNLQFGVEDLFQIDALEANFDLIVSIGVLHHTADPKRAVSILINKLKLDRDSRLYLGLYHVYGRTPFLKFFEELKTQGKTEQDLFSVFSELHGQSPDPEFLWSRFRDQVLHPHESQHSLHEVSTWLAEEGFVIESTSINRFEEDFVIEELFEIEKKYQEISFQKNVIERKYFPGFFTICAKRQ